jgi:hypothetical protein
VGLRAVQPRRREAAPQGTPPPGNLTGGLATHRADVPEPVERSRVDPAKSRKPDASWTGNWSGGVIGSFVTPTITTSSCVARGPESASWLRFVISLSGACGSPFRVGLPRQGTKKIARCHSRADPRRAPASKYFRLCPLATCCACPVRMHFMCALPRPRYWAVDRRWPVSRDCRRHRACAAA